MAPAPLSTLLLRTGEEMSRWADESERLEAVVGAVFARATPTPDELSAVQALDGLTQHLRALALMLDAVARTPSGGGAEPALIRSGLDGLGRRLLGSADAPPAERVGEVELW